MAALLELGAGFNPEFTGRDNVYLNGAIMGLSKRELDQRYPVIEEFAEIGDFINQPVKTYSSGMTMRLAFAVAINLDPEVLIVDEALSVGDFYFRSRCMRKVHELRARGVTILFVSHSTPDIEGLGDRVLWLEHGRAIALGEPSEVLPQYLAAMAMKEGRYVPPPVTGQVVGQSVGQSVGQRRSVEPVTTIPNVDHRHGDGRAEIRGIAILNEYEEPVHLMMPGSRIIVRISFRSKGTLSRPVAGFMMRNHLGFDFTATDTAREKKELPSMGNGDAYTVDFNLDMPEFYPGAFSFSPWITDAADGEVCDWIDNAITVQMGRGDGQVYGCLHIPCRIEVDAQLHDTAEMDKALA